MPRGLNHVAALALIIAHGEFAAANTGFAANERSSATTVQEAKKTVWDGVYTEDQAKRGRQTYQRSCGQCRTGKHPGADRAAAQNNAAAVQALIEAGADVHAGSRGPATSAVPADTGNSRYGARSRRGRLDSFTPLIFAARSGAIDAARVLLDNVSETLCTRPGGCGCRVSSELEGQ